MTPLNNLSVVIITFNEQENLPRLLASLPAGVELIVVDSESSDATRDIARAAGARVEIRKFTGYASQKNAALSFATKDWVFSLDADEVPTRELWAEVFEVVSKSNKSVAARVERSQIFLGKKLRFGKTKDAPIRLIPRGAGHFDQEIHEGIVLRSDVSLIKLKHSLDHYSYKSLTDYFEKFNRYTTAVAVNHKKNKARLPSRVEQCVRFFMEFFWRYLCRGGFLDGYPGFIYALFGSVYVFVKYAKLEELYQLEAKPRC